MEAQKQERDMLRQKELLQVSGLYKTYEGKSSGKQAAPVINGASFSIQANETVGLVGSSGAGKSTIGRIVAGIEQADRGKLIYQGQDLLSMKPKARREATRSIQMIFQDPYESLSARMTIAQLIAEPLVIARLYKNDPARRTELVREALQEVALPPERYMHRYAHELSGGSGSVSAWRALLSPARS